MKTRLLLLSIGVIFSCVVASGSFAAEIFDTGPNLYPDVQQGFNLYGYNSQQHQYLAGQFALTQPTTITGVEGWINVQGSGPLKFVIYSDNILGAVPMPLALYSRTLNLEASQASGWYGPSGLNWQLSSGTYWIAFEAEPGFSGQMPHYFAQPLPTEAFYNKDISPGTSNYHDNGYVEHYLGLGIRAFGETDPASVPLPASLLLLGPGLVCMIGLKRKYLG